MSRCRHCICQDRGTSFPECSCFWLGVPEKEGEWLARRKNSLGLRPTAVAGLASAGWRRQSLLQLRTPSCSLCCSCSVQQYTQSCTKRGQAWPERKLSKATGLRMMTLSQPLRFLSEDAEELAANGAGQEGRKSMEDADNAFPKSLFLCLGRLPQSGEVYTSRFQEGQWLRLPCVVLSTNTGYPSWAGKVHAGCV